MKEAKQKETFGKGIREGENQLNRFTTKKINVSPTFAGGLSAGGAGRDPSLLGGVWERENDVVEEAWDCDCFFLKYLK